MDNFNDLYFKKFNSTLLDIYAEKMTVGALIKKYRRSVNWYSKINEVIK